MKTLIRVLSILGFLTTAGFAASMQDQQSIYLNVGQNFGSLNVTDTVTKNSKDQATKLGKMKYMGNVNLGYQYFVMDKLAVGAEVDVPLIKSLKADNKSKLSDKAGAGFLTVGYDVLDIDMFTTSIRAGVGAGIHMLSMDNPLSGNDKMKGKSFTFAYKIGINQAIKITDNMALNLGVAYVNLGSPKLNKDFGSGTKEKVLIKNKGALNASAGISFSF